MASSDTGSLNRALNLPLVVLYGIGAPVGIWVPIVGFISCLVVLAGGLVEV